jgi:hypothetical protein
MTDDQLERDLERWLDETAVTLPREALLDVMAVIPRENQVRRRWTPRLGGTPGRRVATLAGVVGVLVIVAISGLPSRLPAGLGQTAPPSSVGSLIPSPQTPGLTWDVARDFIHGPNRVNPAADRYGNAGVWSYRFGPVGGSDPATHSLMTVVDTTVDGWSADGYVNLHAYTDADGLDLHPYATREETLAGIVDWRSPVAAPVRIVGRFSHIQRCDAGIVTDGVTTEIDIAGVSSWSERLPPLGTAAFDLQAQVTAGSIISFRVEPGPTSNCDTTRLTVAITGP